MTILFVHFLQVKTLKSENKKPKIIIVRVQEKVFHVSPSQVTFKLKFNARKQLNVRDLTNEFKLFTGCQNTEQTSGSQDEKQSDWYPNLRIHVTELFTIKLPWGED